jgi:Protein of unknown function (DUF2631)
VPDYASEERGRARPRRRDQPVRPAARKEETTVADEQVTAPDQHKPGFPKAARIGAVISIVLLLLMLLGNHRGKVEDLWLLGGAVILAGFLIGDWVMRKNGIRR